MTTRSSGSLLIVLLLTSALFLSASVLLPTPAYAQVIWEVFSPVHGPPGTFVSFKAHSTLAVSSGPCTLAANHPNFFSPGYTRVCNVVGDGTAVGSITGSFRVRTPTEISTASPLPGLTFTYTVTLTTSVASEFVTQTFTVDQMIGFALSSSGPWTTAITAMETQTVYIHGWGFDPASTGCTYGGAPAGSTLLTCPVNAGELSGGFTPPVGSAGAYVVSVTGNSGFGDTASGAITVVSGPAITATPDSFIALAPFGIHVSLSGNGYSLSDSNTCAVSYTIAGPPGALYASAPACTLTTVGSWRQPSATFTVASTASTASLYTLRITGSTGDYAETTFIVSPSPDILDAVPVIPYYAGDMVFVSVFANSFSSLDAGLCTFTFAPSSPAVSSSSICVIDGSGLLDLTTSFVISSSAPGGVYTVMVTGSKGDYSNLLSFRVAPKVTFSPTSGFPPITGPPTATATEVTVTGTGFKASPGDTSCTITSGAASLIIDTSGEPACIVNTSGQLSAKFKVGANSLYVGGGVGVTVTGTPGSDSALALFTVNPRIVLSPTSGAVATTVNYAGSGFTNAPAVACAAAPNIVGAPVDPATKTCSQDANGNVSGQFKVLAGTPSGSYMVFYWDGTIFANANFVVTGGPVVNLSPNTGNNTVTVTVTGSGFNTADTSVTISTSGGPVELEVPTNKVCPVSAGTIAAGCTFTISPTAPGIPAPGYELKVTGNTGDYSKANFFLMATLILTPKNGGAGTLVTLSGSGYRAVSAPCAGIIQTPAPLSAAGGVCNIDGNGVLTGSFNVNNLAVAGAHTLSISNGAQVPQITVSASFTVTVPMITFSPNSGSGDDTIHFSASGFSTGDTGTCSLTWTGLAAELGNPIAATPPPSCNISGGIATGSFVVVRAGNGAHVKTLTLTGSTGDSVTATFSVVPQISHTLTPGGTPANPARVGDTVTITGSNFATPGACTITGASVAGSPSTLAGCVLPDFTLSAVAKFVVVIAFAGLSDTITVNDATPVSASATLYIMPRVVTLTPNSGPVGAVIGVTGTGFAVSDVTPCVITVDGVGPVVSACSMGVGGTVSGSFTIDAGTPAGAHTVTVTGTGGDFGTAILVVTAAVTLVPNIGRAGTIVQVSGTGFAAGDTGCSISSSPSGLISTPPNPVCSIAGGVASGSFVVASVPGGVYTVTVTGSTGDKGSATFTVPPVPTFKLLPTLGPTGQGVTASGFNYQGTTCQLTSSPGGLFASAACTIASGNLTGSFTVASNAVAGTLYTVTAQTNAGALDSATANFAVTVGTAGTLTLTPTSGPIGRVVSGVGDGFTTDTTCQLGASSSAILSSPSCTITAGGNANIGFTVSTSAAPGSYIIMALGNAGRSATGTFTITATSLFSLSANPSTLTINPGGTGTVTVTVQSVGSFNSPVTLAASTFPLGVNGGFNLNPVTPLPGGSANSVLSIAVSSTAPSTSSVITITGTSGTATAMISISLNIQVIMTTLSTSTSVTTTSSVISTTIATVTGPYVPPKCVIATATFGSEASPAVQFLRNFRDKLVLSTTAGSAFIQVFNAWYYSFSPSVAQFIANNDPLRAPVRVFLYPLLGILGASAFTYSLFSASPEFAVVIAGLVASSLIGLVYLTPFTFVGMRALTRRRRIRTISIAKASLLVLATALGLLAAGELAGSFLMLAVASSAIVLTCIIAAPTIIALLVLRPKSQ